MTPNGADAVLLALNEYLIARDRMMKNLVPFDAYRKAEAELRMALIRSDAR